MCNGAQMISNARPPDTTYGSLPMAAPRLLPMSAEAQVESILRADTFRWHVLGVAGGLA